MKRILFVCTGNTCRSLMAEGIALKMLRSLNLEGEIEVSSAGLAAFPDALVAPGFRGSVRRGDRSVRSPGGSVEL